MVDDRRISEMRNLGPASERDLNAAGIFTGEQLRQAGVEGAFLQMLAARQREGRPTAGCNAAYLYAIYGALHDVDFREVPRKQRETFKRFAADLREAGDFP